MLTVQEMIDSTVELMKEACAEAGCDYDEFVQTLGEAMQKRGML